MDVQVHAADFARAASDLDAFPAAVRTKVLELAGGAAAALIAREARGRAPRGTYRGVRGWKASAKYKHRPGTMARAIRARVVKRSAEEVVFSIKPQSKRAWYWRFVEGGTKPHSLRRGRVGWKFAGGRKKRVRMVWGAHSTLGGFHPGARAQPFLQPAADAMAGPAAELMRRSLAAAVAGLQAELARRGRGAA